MLLSFFKNKFRPFLILFCTCCASSAKAILGIKTEVELNGLGVVKESAEILAQSVATFPTKQMSISIIGFIAVSQGLYWATKGLATCICGDGYRPDGKRTGKLYGLTQSLIGIGLTAAGTLTTLYSNAITHYLFSI